MLLNSARAMMFQSGLPIKFWPYSILTATWVINRVPSKVLDWQSPHDVLFGEPPNYTIAKPFGCLAYAANLVSHRGKFTSRSLKCIFLGYDSCHKGYLLYNLDSLKILISRDVYCVPNVFPFLKPDQELPEPPIILPSVTDTDSPFLYIDTTLPPVTSSLESPVSSTLESFSSNDSTHVDSSPVIPDQALRRSTRDMMPPVWMKDYIGSVNTTLHISLSTGITPPTFPYVINRALTKPYIEYLFNLTMHTEPSSFKEASQHPEWMTANDAELTALQQNETWVITDLPPGKIPIGCKWIFKLKFSADGSVEKHKARLVAKGYSQESGIDYHEVFSHVANLVTVRLFIVVATAHSWPLHQIDINNAFLHGYLRDDIYRLPPPGLSGAQRRQVCKLVKSLYGLKQDSREWNAEFSKFVSSLGFMASVHDTCLFTRGRDDIFIVLLVYVDDILITGPVLSLIEELKSVLHNAYTIKDLGLAKYFLGMEIARNDAGTSLSQRKYVLDILSTHGMLCCKPASTPLPSGISLAQGDDPHLQQPDVYRKLVGQLLYLNLTRPDISHATQQLSQFMANPTMVH